MAAFDPATRLQRLEQQLVAFERLHGDELREFQRRLEAYQRLHEDEVRLLREEIADLRAALAAAEAGDEGPPAAEGSSPAASRRPLHADASSARPALVAVDESSAGARPASPASAAATTARRSAISSRSSRTSSSCRRW